MSDTIYGSTIACATPLLRAEEISLAFVNHSEQGSEVFSGFSADLLNKSEFVAILGPSGCGKTTLLNVVAGVLQPTSGQLIWSGGKPRVGYVFQDYPFLPTNTVAQHIGFSLQVRKTPTLEIAHKVRHWLSIVGLDGYADYGLDALSAGMRARVALATVMINSPDLVLMDEPFSALDVETRFVIWEVIRHLRQEYRFPAMLVTHDVTEAITLADRIIILTRSPTRVFRERIFEDKPDAPLRLLMKTEGFRDLYHTLLLDMQEAIAAS